MTGLNAKSQALFQNVHSVQVSQLLACYGSLWVGSNLGILVNFPLPRLEGVPLVNGPAMVAYHTHGGPVKFMLGLEINRQSDRIHYSSKEDSNDSEYIIVFFGLSSPKCKIFPLLAPVITLNKNHKDMSR